MCSFGSCQTRFELLSQFRKVRNVFECFVTQVQTRWPNTKCVWPMKINVIYTVYLLKKIETSKANISAMKNFPRHTTERTLLGLASYFRRFMKDFAQITGPLINRHTSRRRMRKEKTKSQLKYL